MFYNFHIMRIFYLSKDNKIYIDSRIYAWNKSKKSVKGKLAFRCSNLFLLLAFFTESFCLNRMNIKCIKRKIIKMFDELCIFSTDVNVYFFLVLFDFYKALFGQLNVKLLFGPGNIQYSEFSICNL